MKTNIIVLLLLIVTLIGCKKDKKSSPVPHTVSIEQNVLNSNAHVVDTSAIVAMTATSITFNKSSMSFSPAVGDILLASPSAKDTLGLFVQVLNVTANGNEVICTTQISNLNDAFKELHINYTYTGVYSGATQINALNRNALYVIRSNSLASTTGTTLNISFNNKNIGGFILNGNLQVNIPDTKIKYVKMSGSNLPDTVLIAADLNISGSQLQITSPTVKLNEQTLYTFNLPTLFIPVAIGPVIIPIPFTQTVKINVLPASITGQMSLTVLPQISATLGLSYENGTWKNLSTYSIKATADSLLKNNFSASVAATATVFNPVYTISPFGSDANNLFFDIPNDLALNIQTATPNYLLIYNLGVSAGVNANFWNGLVQAQLTIGGTLYTDTLLKGNFKQPTILLKDMINNENGDTIATFNYKGTQLSNVTILGQTHVFNYDNRGHLTGTTITGGGAPSGAGSIVTYQSDTISEIKFHNYAVNGQPEWDIKLTFSNGYLTNWTNPYFEPANNGIGSVSDTYQYDSSNHNTTEIVTDSNPETITKSNFDNKQNLMQIIPFWYYFEGSVAPGGFPVAPGVNNPLQFIDNGIGATISYVYNSYGYPTNMTIKYNSPNTPVTSVNYDYIIFN